MVSSSAKPQTGVAAGAFVLPLGPEHPQVATVLENYAALLHKLNRDAEADKMEARTQAIRAKHAQENPAK